MMSQPQIVVIRVLESAQHRVQGECPDRIKESELSKSGLLTIEVSRVLLLCLVRANRAAIPTVRLECCSQRKK